MRTALIVSGGWNGHRPAETTRMVADHLVDHGWEVTVRESLDAFDDEALLARQRLVVPNWTMGAITDRQERNVASAVEAGAGLAGWHGGMADAFRASPLYNHVVGGQFVNHPGGIRRYVVRIVDRADPITAGIDDFEVESEQYYMHVDPTNHVLATSSFGPDEAPGVAGATMPVAWKRHWGAGRVFYVSVGHTPADLARHEVWTMLTRGLAWAGRAAG